MWCLARWGAVRRSTLKNLYHGGETFTKGFPCGYLNTFSEETSGVHSDRSLKYLSFFQRQCVVLTPTKCHEEILSCKKRKVCLQRDYYSAGVAKSFCGRNMQSSFQQIILKFWLCLQRQSVVVGPAEYHKTKLLH